MEIHFFPSEGAVLEREGILRGFADAGLSPTSGEDEELWVVSFESSSVFVDFQFQNDRLSFATLDMPLLSEEDISHTAFVALEEMGWMAQED